MMTIAQLRRELTTLSKKHEKSNCVSCGYGGCIHIVLRMIKPKKSGFALQSAKKRRECGRLGGLTKARNRRK